MRALKLKEVLFLILPLAFISMLWIYAKYPALNVDSVTLVGFPYPYRRDALGSSFDYAWYIKGLLINIAFYGAIWYSLLLLFWHRIKSRILKVIFYSLAWIYLVYIFRFYLLFIEHQSLQWDYNFPSEYLGKIEFFC